MTIGLKLTRAFVSLALVIAVGAVISSWQFTVVLQLTKRITATDDRLMNVYRVRADVGALRRRMADLSRDEDLPKFAAAIDSSRTGINHDIRHALASFRASGVAVPDTLNALDDTVDDQLDAMRNLAAVKDWLAIQRRIDNQLEEIVDDARVMVDDVAANVYAERELSIREIERARQRAEGILFATAVISLAISLVLGYRVTRNITNPLSRLDAAARRLAAGDFDVEIHVDSKDELGKLGEALSVAAKELKTYYAALRRSNEDLESFAYAASHDLQEPLRTITSFSALLKARCGSSLGSHGEQYLTFIMDAATRMRNLITGILEYSRLTSSKDETFQGVLVGEVVRDVLNNLHATIHQAGAQIECARLPVVTGSRVQLTQLFQNLIGNAVKYRREDEPLRIQISAERDGQVQRFCVADNGVGIDPKYHDHIFGMFKQLNRDARGGVGVGLAVAKRIVEKHGGAIWVESEVGRGARFYLTLAAEAELRPISTPESLVGSG